MTRSMILALGLALLAGCGTPTATPPPAPGATPAATPGATEPASPGATEPAQTPGQAVELAAVERARLATSPSDAEDAGRVVNAFGVDLYRRVVAADPSADVVISPASIALALAMARAGAAGDTATEMDAVMRNLGLDTNAAWVAALDASLNAKTLETTDAMGDPVRVTLRSVNAPFAQRGYPLQDAFLDALAVRFGAGLRLGDTLAAMGMPMAFDPERADFSGMTEAERLVIGEVAHQANIDVDENGTEAAAATAVEMAAGAAPSEPKELVADHPFLFALRDLGSGAVLFLGRVTQPEVRS
jgi:serine protease inhibitor